MQTESVLFLTFIFQQTVLACVGGQIWINKEVGSVGLNYSRKSWPGDEAQQITKDRWGGVATSILSKSPAFTGMTI